MALLHKASERGDYDLEAWEEAIRNAVLRYGASLPRKARQSARPKSPSFP